MSTVKVTERIRNEVARLFLLEIEQIKNGTINKGYKAGWYQTQTANNLKFNEDNGPSLRSYEKLLRTMRGPKAGRGSNKEVGPLDKPWTIGSCIKTGCNIPADMIPILLKLKRVIVALGRRIPIGEMTIRHARWFTLLYPSIRDLIKNKQEEIKKMHMAIMKAGGAENRDIESFLEMLGPDSLELLSLITIGFHYATQEQIREVSDTNLDTSDLDNIYFLPEKLSALAFFDAAYVASITPEGKKQRDDIIAHGFPTDKLESIYGKLSLSQVENLNSFFREASSSYSQADEWIKQHPVEYAEINKLLEARK